MTCTRTSSTEILPDDPAAEMVADAISEILLGAQVDLAYRPVDAQVDTTDCSSPVASATGAGPNGWAMEIRIQLNSRIASLSGSGDSVLRELLESLPGAGIRVTEEFRSALQGQLVGPALQRAIRDTVVSEALASLLSVRFHHPIRRGLLDETVDFLIELGGVRVEA